MFTRAYGDILNARLAEPRRFIQIVAGPRHVGKTTLVRQVTSTFEVQRPVHFASADEPLLRSPEWLGQQWRAGMLTGMQKYAGEAVRARASSPKLQVLNTELVSALRAPSAPAPPPGRRPRPTS